MKNKKIILSVALCLSIASNAYCKNTDEMGLGIKKAQDIWAEAKYVKTEKSEKIAEFEKCAQGAAELSKQFPQNAEPLIWQGICTASQCELLKLSALGKAKEAKSIFEKAAAMNDKALDGSAYTNLGVLYHRVPGWPIGFGNTKLAEENFQKAVAIAPNNIDANYFYALFLIDEKRYDEAKTYLNLASNAPSRNRPLADAKRKEEVAATIVKLEKLQK
jgi:tetratricopeptide (TPR) repeat protein